MDNGMEFTGDPRGDLIGGAAVADAMARLAAELDAILGAPGAETVKPGAHGNAETADNGRFGEGAERNEAGRYRLACRYGWKHAGAARAARLENPWRKLSDGIARIARDYPGAFNPPAPSIVRRLVIPAAPLRRPSIIPAIDGRAAWLASGDGRRVWNVRAFRVGGIRFLRIGQIQISACMCRKPFEGR